MNQNVVDKYEQKVVSVMKEITKVSQLILQNSYNNAFHVTALAIIQIG